MTTNMKKILGICDRNFFARFSGDGKSISQLKLGPPGELLRKNIYHEWMLNCVIRTENVFPFYSKENSFANFSEPFLHAKQSTSSSLPFGIAVQVLEQPVSDSCNSEFEYNELQTVLKTYMFLNPEKSNHYFDDWQQSQKAWWRKISACPERFSLSEVENQKSESKVQILAEFDWGKRSLETISLNLGSIFNSLDSMSKEVFEIKYGRKKILPHVLISSISLESAVITFLCDAYDECTNKNLCREVMRFHRKLAPYKASFSITTSTSVSSDLSDLAEFLAKHLRNVGVSVLLLPDSSKKSLESQFVRNDELGIPFTIVMNESTLKNGIVSLRSRDTTLKEQAHVTDLKKYMLQLFENY